jgi:deazaflavin-dependent oxidoreductase (nitroreductase family)
MSEPNTYNHHLIEQFRATGGNTDFPGPLLLLTTTGAKSGQPRTTPLAYATDGDRLVVVASNGGAPTHPDRYHNLLAHPIVTVELGVERFQARAIVATGQERAWLAAQYAALMPGLAEHQRRTTRQIPLVIVERMD